MLLLVLLLTIFEGAIRKWVVAGNPGLRYFFYFSKDFVFIAAALVGMSQARSFGRTIGILLAVSLLTLSLPTLLNLPRTTAVGAILSLRAYLILPLCAFAVGCTLRSLRDLDWIARCVGVSTIMVAALGIVQFYSPPTHFLNRYETVEETTHIIAEFQHVRATGTFAFITGMAMMTGVGSWAGIYLFLSTPSLLGRAFAAAVLLAGLCCGLVSMSRGGIVLYAATVIGGIILFGSARDSFYLLLVFAIGYGVFGGASPEDNMDGGLQGATLRRFEEHDSVGNRADYMLMNLRRGFFNHPFGEGLGRGQNGGNYSEGGTRSWGGGYESEVGRIGFEVGPLGWVGVMSWRVAAIILMWHELRRTKERKPRAMLAASLPLFSLLAMNYMAFNHTGSSFGWAIFSLALGAAYLPPPSAPAATDRPTRPGAQFRMT